MRAKPFIFLIFIILVVPLFSFSSFSIPRTYAQEQRQNTFGNIDLPDWKNITVTVSGDGKSFMLDNANNLTWVFWYGAKKYGSIYQGGIQIVKDELWLLQVYEGSWKDIGTSVDVSYERRSSYNVLVTQKYTSTNGDYNVTWDFYGGFRPKITFSAEITIGGNYRIDWRTYVYKDYAQNMANYVKFWNEGEEAIVLDYSDVYWDFGSITSVEGLSGWIKGKRLDLVFAVGNLEAGLFELDPTFGYENIGASLDNWPTGYMGVAKAVLTEDGTITKLTAYTRGEAAGNIIGCIYSDSSGSPNTLLSYSSATAVTTSYAWVNITMSYAATAGTYWLGWMPENSVRTYFAYNTGTGTNWAYKNGLTYPTLPDPFTENGGGSELRSIYATYTTGQTLSKTISQAITFAESTSRASLLSRTIVQSLAFSMTTSRLIDLTRSITQVVSFNLGSSYLIDIIRQMSQALSFSVEALGTSVLEYLRNISQAIAFSSTSSRLIEISRDITQTMDFALSSWGGMNEAFTRAISMIMGFTVSGAGAVSPIVLEIEALAGLAVILAIAAIAIAASKKD